MTLGSFGSLELKQALLVFEEEELLLAHFRQEVRLLVHLDLVLRQE